MSSICIPANSVLYKTGALMLIAGAIPLADAILLMNYGAMQTGFAVPTVLMAVFGCYGIVSGMLDVHKWQRAKKTPALIITDEGITDATGIVTGGLIRWDEVESVSKIALHGHYSLAIQLTDPSKYLARLPRWKRLLLSPTAAEFGTPCLIAETELAVPLDQARLAMESARVRFEAPDAEPVGAPAAHWWTAIPPEERNVVSLTRGR